MRDHEAVRWLQVAYKVPSEPSLKRVRVWRRLQNLGAYPLQNSVYVLPLSEEVEKQFRLLAREIRQMGGEASIFIVTALDVADEQRIVQALVETRNNEYDAVLRQCEHFLVKLAQVTAAQSWGRQVQAECAAALEKVHVLFRTARRRDLLEKLTASNRAGAAEALAMCEQIFRLLADRDYIKARRLLEQQGGLLYNSSETDSVDMNVMILESLPVQQGQFDSDAAL